jgi:hypothetical protein
MYALTWNISSYDGHDLILGIFSTEESALKARKIIYEVLKSMIPGHYKLTEQ